MHVPPTTHQADAPGFRRDYHEEFLMVLGADQATKWMAHLDTLLAASFDDDEEDASALRKKAHAMVPLAGTAGFLELARLCGELDRAIASGDAYSDRLSSVRQEAKRAATMLSRLQSDLSLRMRRDED